MTGILMALLAGTVALSQPLQAVIARLDQNPDSAHVQEITAAIAASPALTRQFNELAVADTLKSVEIGSITGRFGATHKSGVIRLTPQFIDDQTPTSGDLSQATRNIIFVLGYEASKVATEPAENTAEEQDRERLKKLIASTPKGTSPDLTSFVKEGMDRKIANEARAYLQGWNDVLDAMALAKQRELTPAEVFQSLHNGRNTQALLAAATLSENQRIQPGPHFQFPASSHNLTAVMTALGSTTVPDFM